VTSFAQELGLDHEFLRISIINRVAYAAAADALGFPGDTQSDTDAELAASLPVTAPQWVRRAEAATALQGAASASLVIDQMLALKLIAESATAYMQARLLYGLFLAAGLGIPQVRHTNLAEGIATMLLESGVDATRQEYRTYGDALINPVQLSYLALSLAVNGEHGLARQLLNAPFFPQVTVPVGPTGITNTDLFVLVLGEPSPEWVRSERNQNEVYTDLSTRVESQLQWQRAAPRWRQRLPWYVGLDCDITLLMIAIGDQLQDEAPGVVGIMQQIAATTGQLRNEYLERILDSDLADGIRIRLLREGDLNVGDIMHDETLWHQEFD
jgi:hypothetical protein